MPSELVVALIIACWAYCLPKMVDDGEIFAGYGRWVNRILHGQDSPPDPTTLGPWKNALWHYTYCNFCLAGMLGTAYAILTLNPLALAICPAVAMVATQVISKITA